MKLSTLLFFLAQTLLAAPAITKIEPPNWWPAHTRNPLQILLTGTDLQSATITSPKGFRTEIRSTSADGHYLFLYTQIPPTAKPGTYPFCIKTPTGETTFPFTLAAPLAPQGRFQGITANDVIYLLMPDRFSNGDPTNDSPATLGPPANPSTVLAWHGGDLKGIHNQLPYLKDLGVTGIWLTPTYQNSNPAASPYHGYHAVDFYAVEPRFGTLPKYRALVDAAHALGIKVVQDQVANHTGPDHPWLKAPPAPHWIYDADKLPRTRNTFDIASLADPYSRPNRRKLTLEGWFAGHLPDLDQTNPLVADYLIQNALWWLGSTGVDGIRQDTYPYADRPFWEAWQTAIDKQYPGYWVTGEVTARTPAALSFFEGGTRRRGVDTKLPSLLDFPLETAMRQVFAEGKSLTQLTAILEQDHLFLHPERLVSFLGNHDNARFLTLATGDTSKLKMAQAFLLTTPRIPHLYYGDELAMGAGTDRTDRTVRADFPAQAFTPEGRTGPAAEVHTWLRDLLKLRATTPALRSGTMTILKTTDDQLSYLRQAGPETILVVLNRVPAAPSLNLDTADLNFPAGKRFVPILAASGAIETAPNKLVLTRPAPVNIYSLR